MSIWKEEFAVPNRKSLGNPVGSELQAVMQNAIEIKPSAGLWNFEDNDTHSSLPPLDDSSQKSNT
jgi:hypothetical protein